ncbi:hypothetical protein AG1IA_10116 [Rhizoctonia solani AG-1 IA]|uniref:Uncharacterized protein n=1 Tax=Thanatephorus cucumeris (strain AG1-IA) TaxID=983506 RepID=L8WHL2_THACA|nr:hypothetical protein AG1IA_10116 [Rhizoctonia solani AG-1 IA]
MPNLGPYLYGKPKSKYWKQSWGDQGPKSGSKPYAGPRQGTKTRAKEHATPAMSQYMDQLQAQAVANAFSHPDALDMTVVGLALPNTSGYLFTPQATTWGDAMSMAGTPRAHSPALMATTINRARQDIQMSTTRDPKIAAQVAMLNSINAPGGVTNGANVLHTLPEEQGQGAEQEKRTRTSR